TCPSRNTREDGDPAVAVRSHRATVSPPGDTDRGWMRVALEEATAAGARGEVPVGAVVVIDDRLVARAGNRTIADCDPTAHAEILALRTAAAVARNHRLTGATLYATVEPCAMCMGAALQARIARLVYGCADPKGGAAGTLFDLASDPRLNHRIAVTTGVGEPDCRHLLQAFFRGPPA